MGNDLDKDIEILKNLQEELKEDMAFFDYKEVSEAIENVLSELEIKDKIIKTDEMMLKEDGIYIQELKSELETYKKIAEKLA